jgi:hypothetical protein
MNALFDPGPGGKALHHEPHILRGELTYYFLRGVGEQPVVSYDAGVYTVSGLMQTTHPGDRSPVTVFNGGSEPSSLDFCTDPKRQDLLRGMYGGRELRWDGRD